MDPLEGDEVWEYEQTAKLIKINRSQNSCRTSPSERKLVLALEDKTRKILEKLKLKHLVGKWELGINFLYSSYVFIIIVFCFLAFGVIFRHSVF